MKASRLRVLRVEAGLTQRELSDLSGVDMSYISMLETRAKTNVTLRLARKLASALSQQLGRTVTVLELFPEEEAHHSSSQATRSA